MATGVVFYRQKANVCVCIEGHPNANLLFTLKIYCSAWLTDHCKSWEDVSLLTLTRLSTTVLRLCTLGGDGAFRQCLCLASVQMLPVWLTEVPVPSRSWAWRKAACRGRGLLVHPSFNTFPGHWKSKTSVCLLSLSLQGCKAWSGKRQVQDNSLTLYFLPV